MPAFEGLPPQSTGASDEPMQFPPVTRDQILHSSYDYWFPKYRTSTIRSRIIPLPQEFIDYIREDGIILADDDETSAEDDDDDWEPTSTSGPGPMPGVVEEEEEEDSDEESPARLPPNQRFPSVHQAIKDKIEELGGAVAPKLNWSSPKDAAWISRHQNTMKCTTPNDVYLLLKSSSLISHDLELAFDGTAPLPPGTPAPAGLGFSPVLVLRSFFNPHGALEFRCFVKQRSLVGIAQRDLNHYPFLDKLRPAIITRVKELFDKKLRFTFPDGNFTFDVYIPEAGDIDSDDEEEGSRLSRARLIDINPWAPRTDSLLFDWQELLELQVPRPMLGTGGEEPSGETEDETTTDDDEGDGDDYVPELRIVEKDDPSAYNFSTPQYSAHKLPKEVVDASMGGEGGMREFAQQWNQMMERR